MTNTSAIIVDLWNNNSMLLVDGVRRRQESAAQESQKPGYSWL
jgi:hypothetical protein